MGSTHSSLSKAQLREYVEKTHFETSEVTALHAHFSMLSEEKNDQLVNIVDFQRSLQIKSSLFVERIFTLFDKDRDGYISFSEYLSGLSVLSSRGTLSEKIGFSFHIYDFDEDGMDFMMMLMMTILV